MEARDRTGSGHGWCEVFVVALALGLTSFGGPTAHIGYFERAYVQRRKWLSQSDFAGLLAVCQVVPGPVSSQLGMAIGMRRAGVAGGLAAWLGFTLPSALLMTALALVLRAGWRFSPVALTIVHGLKLVAVAIVAQAVWTMARNLCPDWQRRLIAVAGLAVVVAAGMMVAGSAGGQLIALIVGAILGARLCRVAGSEQAASMIFSRQAGWRALAVFAGGLMLASVAVAMGLRGPIGLAAVVYRAGALVVGGGHVVLPLLHQALVPTGWIGDQGFLAGYGAAQALPGPLFALAAYLGGVCAPAGAGWPVAVVWSVVALVAMFLPGMLAVAGALPVWESLSRHSALRGALAGVNAAVVGVLAAAFYDPVVRTGLTGPIDGAIALTGFALLVRWRAPPLAVVILTVAACVGVGMG